MSEAGESITEAVVISLRERLERTSGRRPELVLRRLDALADELATLPVVDARPADEILGYDRDGLPS